MVSPPTATGKVTRESLAAFRSRRAFCDWKARVESVGGCARPVKLNKRTTATTRMMRTGLPLTDVIEDRAVWVRCGTRRAAACPSCSAWYEADAFHLVRAGLVGDEPKGVPASVAARPTVFVTLTAPSFGPVHSRPGHRPCACRAWHGEADTRLGQAVDPARYDFEAAVLWNNRAGALWADFTRRLRRTLAQAGGLTVREANEAMKVSYAKVAEYQRRGQVHFHAAIRIDGPTGPGSTPPAWATVAVLDGAVRAAAAATEVDTQRADRTPLTLRWGTQLDIQTVTAGPAETAHGNAETADGPAETARGSAETADRSAGVATCGSTGTVQAAGPGAVQAGRGRADAARVASYIAKYATKSTGATDGIDQRVRTLDDIEATGANPHAKTMMRTALRLAEAPHLAGLRLDQWAHMLGYRGHFLTKSRAFSTTFAALRDARTAWTIAKHQLDTDNTADVLIDVTWTVIGYGYRTPEERHEAAAIAEDIATRARQRHAPTRQTGATA